MEQHNNDDMKKELAQYRMETAKDDLRAAKILLDAGEYKAANNRAYYAIFHAINAVHAIAGNGYKRHKDAIANFNKEYVKTEIFPSDYDDFYIATKEEAKNQIATAECFGKLVEKYILEYKNES